MVKCNQISGKNKTAELCANCTHSKYPAEVRAMKSAAGWYVGTKTKDGFPNCRISGYTDEKTCNAYADEKGIR